MAKHKANGLTEFLNRLALRKDGAGLSDAALLELYLARRDEAAFEALVRRHGSMVLGVCRRVLGNDADAEDAFQAAFLVLVAKAGTIQPREMVGSWLYGVAHNVARKARAMNNKRRAKEKEIGARAKLKAKEKDSAEVLALLDGELGRLPENYRVAIILCDLEGKTIREAAQQLGWPQGTVATRLARGRAMLARRLAKHGLPLFVAAGASVCADKAALATVSPGLIASTVKAAAAFAADQVGLAAVVSTHIAALTRGVLKTMLLSKVSKINAMMLIFASLVSVVGISTSQGLDGMFVDRERTPLPQRSAEALPARGQQRIPSWHERATLIGHEEQVNVVAFSPDGKTLASGGQDCAVLLWDLAAGTVRAALRGHKEPIGCVVFSPDGKLVASGGGQADPKKWNPSSVKLWDADSGKERSAFTLGKTGGRVMAVAFSPDGKILAGAGDERGYGFEGSGAVSADGVSAVGNGFQPIQSGVVRLWETATGKPLATLRKKDLIEFRNIAFSPDGKTLATVNGRHATSDQGNVVELWDWSKQKELLALHAREKAEHRNDSGLIDIFTHVFFSPDGKTLATMHTSAGIQFWDAKTGVERKKTRVSLERRAGWELSAAIRLSPDGKTLALAEARFEVKDQFRVSIGQVTLWDGAGKMRQRLPEETSISCMAFSSDSKMLATGNRGNVKVSAEPLTQEELAAGKQPKMMGDKRGIVKVWEWRP